MEDVLNAIKRGISSENYYSALFLAILVPSICGALESDDGQDNEQRYTAWYDRYVNDLFLKGVDCYRLRCSLLHQASTVHPSSSFSRVLFTLPNPQGTLLHNNFVEGALNLDISLFCQRFIHAAEQWLKEVRDTPHYQRNVKNTVKLYPNGLSPFIKGLPIIS
ncbi:MAG: hypothetical protein G01um1014106_256 [Parcubacteria group bacterium Gr01-1014_106]|nr:MAG: hypothetical protein G01um1014106_256 [Parcubacteria group bacterium Gr01-1014_106]